MQLSSFWVPLPQEKIYSSCTCSRSFGNGFDHKVTVIYALMHDIGLFPLCKARKNQEGIRDGLARVSPEMIHLSRKQQTVASFQLIEISFSTKYSNYPRKQKTNSWPECTMLGSPLEMRRFPAGTQITRPVA